MVTDGTTELDLILEKALRLHDYRAGVIMLMQSEHDRVNRYNKKNPPGAGDSLLAPMFSYLLDRYNEAWAKVIPSENTDDALVEKLKKSPATLALMSMMVPEVTLGQFCDALKALAKDVTRN